MDFKIRCKAAWESLSRKLENFDLMDQSNEDIQGIKAMYGRAVALLQPSVRENVFKHQFFKASGDGQDDLF